MNLLIKNVIGNYYGDLRLMATKNNFYLTLENYDGENKKRVSEEFALAFIKEFGDKK